MSPPASERAERIARDVLITPQVAPFCAARTAQRAVPTIDEMSSNVWRNSFSCLIRLTDPKPRPKAIGSFSWLFKLPFQEAGALGNAFAELGHGVVESLDGGRVGWAGHRRSEQLRQFGDPGIERATRPFQSAIRGPLGSPNIWSMPCGMKTIRPVVGS